MAIVRTGLLLIIFALPLFVRTPALAANYEESLKQLAEGVIAEAVRARKQRLAFLDFTDSKGSHTPIGQFLADELSTQIQVAGELNVVERKLVHSTLKMFRVTQIEPAYAKAVRRAAKAIRADVFVTGSFLDSPEGLLVTTKLISPLNAQVIGAARGTLPKAGPLEDMMKETNIPPPVTLEGPQEPPLMESTGTAAP